MSHPLLLPLPCGKCLEFASISRNLSRYRRLSHPADDDDDVGNGVPMTMTMHLSDAAAAVVVAAA